MKVHSLFVRNTLDNIVFMMLDEATGTAVCADPTDADLVNEWLKKHGHRCSHVFNTHEHYDHTAGNSEVVKSSGAKLWTVEGVSGADHRLQTGDQINLGDSVIHFHYTPGHTMKHFCAVVESKGRSLQLFSGDTLFNAGVGRCGNGGDVDTMFDTFERFFKNLDDSVEVYPAHDYIENNLNFAKSVDPTNKHIDEMLDRVRPIKGTDQFLVTTMKEERQINPFLRLDDLALRKSLQLEGAPRIDVFRHLRKKRDNW